LTDGGKLNIKLKVAEADQRDVGKGIVRIDEGFREKLGLKPFDVLEAVLKFKPFLQFDNEQRLL